MKSSASTNYQSKIPLLNKKDRSGARNSGKGPNKAQEIKKEDTAESMTKDELLVTFFDKSFVMDKTAPRLTEGDKDTINDETTPGGLNAEKITFEH